MIDPGYRKSVVYPFLYVIAPAASIILIAVITLGVAR
jgi:hypothetical protein